MQDVETTLAKIGRLAEMALRTSDLPSPAAQALREIVALTEAGPGDTPEASDPPLTENQTL